MKLLALLISSLLLVQSAEFCSEDIAVSEDTQTEVSLDQENSSEPVPEDDCTDLCACQCCSSQGLPGFTLPANFHASIQVYFHTLDHGFISQGEYLIWTPPKIVNAVYTT